MENNHKQHDCTHHKIKLLYLMSSIIHCIEEHGEKDMHAIDPEFRQLVGEIHEKLKEFMSRANKLMCKGK